VAEPVSLEEARRRFLAALPAGPAGGAPAALAAALGRVLALAACADRDLPPFDRSLVDGFAVRCGGAARPTLAGAVAMGGAAPTLPADGAIAVPTGGMIPDGADAVVMQEHVTVGDGWVEIHRPPVPEQNIVRRGSDAAAGDVVVPAGARLRPPEIAMLGTVGVGRVRVRPRPRIAVLSTGDELAPVGVQPRLGQVPDSNAPALCAALQRDGAKPVFLGIVPDARVAVVKAVRRGLRYDALVCTGGSSVGERDYVQGALEEVLGAPPLFSGISIRPGRPTAAFVVGGQWAVALPGHAVSALVVYEVLLREVILRFGGETNPRLRGTVQVTLAAEVRAPADRDLFERVRIDDGRAVPLRGPAATVGNLARADALVRCAAGQVLEAGTSVQALVLD